MSGVWMRHPDLPKAQLIEADPLQVSHYAASGWVTTDPPPPAPPAAVPSEAEASGSGNPQIPDSAPEPGPEPEPDSPTRRRSTASPKETT
jgi:hypothetical protein